MLQRLVSCMGGYYRQISGEKVEVHFAKAGGAFTEVRFVQRGAFCRGAFSEHFFFILSHFLTYLICQPGSDLQH